LRFALFYNSSHLHKRYKDLIQKFKSFESMIEPNSASVGFVMAEVGIISSADVLYLRIIWIYYTQ